MKNEYDLKFIKKEDLVKHVENTIFNYNKNLEMYNLKKFNRNTIDPIKMLFDVNVNNSTVEDIIEKEIYRQRDKSNSNEIGYFHQNIFKYFDGCEVLPTGWDVEWTPKKYINMDGSEIKKIKVELKNKHNTMNSSSSANTYKKMMSSLSKHQDHMFFLVETISKKSQNTPWAVTIDGKKMINNKIRRVSIDEFYAMVTGDDNAFFKLCETLPEIIKDVCENSNKIQIKKDTVYPELIKMINIEQLSKNGEDQSLLKLLFSIGFNGYKGFE